MSFHHRLGGEPEDEPPRPTTQDNPIQLVFLQDSVLRRLEELHQSLSKAVLKQKILGEIDALDWVMQQIDALLAPQNPAKSCNTCHGQGWVIEGQSMGFPSGEQIECPDCIPPSPVDMTQQQPGESRAEWKNRTFAMQYGIGYAAAEKRIARPTQESHARNQFNLLQEHFSTRKMKKITDITES